MAHPLFRAETQFVASNNLDRICRFKNGGVRGIKNFIPTQPPAFEMYSDVPLHLYQSILLQSSFVTPDIGTVPESTQVPIH